MRNFLQNCFNQFPKKASYFGTIIFVLLSVFTNAQTVQTITATGTGSFIVPFGVTSIYVECWGGGGAGGTRTSAGVSGGGAGGAYAATTLAVTAGSSINYFVGAGGIAGSASVNGGDSWFSSNSTVMAKGGTGVGNNNSTGALAALVSQSVGTVKFKGGDGKEGNTVGTDYGGGGGSSAGTSANGNNAISQVGATAPTGGGNGGSGKYSSEGNGTDGSAPGGGGGGALRTGFFNTRYGGDGGRGQIRITYTALTYKSQLVGSIDYGSSNWCTGTSRNVTVQIKNVGTATWNDGGPGVINVGIKWNTNGGNWTDYYVRLSAGTVAPNQIATYVFPLTASNHNGAAYTTALAAGANNISIDVVYEGVSWFGNNGGGIGPGNTKFTTPAITISTVPTSVIASGSPNPVCEGSSLSLTGSAAGATSWNWTGPNGFLSGAQNTSVPAFSSANVGVYTLVASNGCGPASPVNTANINLQSLPTVSAPASLCLGSTTNLTPSSGGTWVSSNPSAATVTNAGLVTATGTGTASFSFTQSSTGCSNTTSVMTINPRPSAVITSGSYSICSDNTATVISGNVTATGNWTLTLSNGSTATGNGNGSFNISVSPASTTTYTITSLSDQLCNSTPADLSGSSTITVNQAVQINVQPQATQSICSSFPVSFTVSATGTGLGYQWYLGTTALADNGHYSGTQSATLNIDQAALSDAGAYHVVVSGTAPCASVVSEDAVLNVSQDITIINQPQSQVKCAGETVSFSINATGSNLSYVWRRGTTPLVDGGNISGAHTPILTISNLTAGDAASNYNVVVSGNGICPQVISVNVSLTVNPIPNTVITPSNQSICSGANISPLVFSGAIPGTSFSWTRDNAAVTGSIGTSGSGNVSGTLANSGLVPETVTFTVTPVASGCYGNPSTATIVVNPVAHVIPSVASQTICSGQPVSDISFTSDVAGASFTWTRNNPSVTGTIGTNGSGTIQGTLSNPSANPVTVTFTITPTANGCAGTPVQVTVLVNPSPVTTVSPSSQNICNNGNITTIVLSSATAGTSYRWTRNNPSGINSAIPLNGTGNISGSFSNIGTDPQTVQFSITGEANGCEGVVSIASIVVNPTAQSSVNIANQTLCSQSVISNIIPSSTTPGAVMQWVRDNPSVTGMANSGSGIVSGSLNNAGNTDATVNFQFTPVINGCAGTPVTSTVVLNAKPSLLISPATQNICYETGAVSINLSNPNNVSGSSIVWTRDNPSGFVTTIPMSGTGNISGTVTNNGTSNITMTFAVTITAPNGCATSGNAIVTLYPELIAPTITSSQVVCSGSTPAPLTGTAASGGSGTYSYQWQSSTTGSAPWTNVGTNSLTYAAPSQARYYRLLVNDGSCGQKASNTIQISVASSFADNFTTDPAPTTAFCSGSTFNYVINSLAIDGLWSPASNYVRFSWTGDPAYITNGPSNPYGETKLGWIFIFPYFYFQGDATFTLQNLTSAPVTTPITITPSLYNSSGNVVCNLTPKIINVTINPVPVVNAVANQTLCAGTAITPVSFSGVATSYSWTNSNTGIGLSASGTGNLPNFTPVNNGTAPVTATITVTPTYTNLGRTCTGTPKSFTITVNPKPTVNAISNLVVCNNGPVPAINFGSNLSGVTYTWTNDNPSIGLAASGSGSSIAGFTAINNGSSPVVATISVTATYTNNAVGCPGTPRTFTITVNPNVTAGVISGNNNFCIGGLSTLVSNGTPGGTWSSDNNLVATVNPSSGAVTAVGQGSGNIIYTVNSGCNSPQQASYPITVNPDANSGVISGTGNLCIGTSSNFTSNGAPGGTWSSSNTSILTVNSSGQVNAIAQGSANITYTVNGCNANPASYSVIVNPNAMAGVLSGAASLCAGSTSTFSSNGDAGGSWSSSNNSIATVDAGSGLVTAIGPGTVTITYLVSSGCNAPKSATKTLTVNPSANAGIITGSATMCPGISAFFFSSGDAGTWSSSNTSVATVNPSTGLVSTVSQGTTNIIYTVSTGCNSPVNTSFALTVNPSAPGAIPGNITGETPVCINTSSFSYSVPNTANASGYTWGVPAGWNILSGQGTNTITVSSGNAGGNITVMAINACGNGPVKTKPVGVIPAGTWSGVFSTDWNSAQNWCGGIPTSTTNVLIPAGTPNAPKIHATAFANDLDVQNGATLDLDDQLILNGSIIAHSNIEAAQGTLELAGSGPRNIAANIFQNNEIGHLKISNSGTVNLNGTLNVLGSVSFSGAGSVFETNDHLTLRSTNNNTAWIGDLTGRVINGNVTVERYIPNHSKAWQFISVPATGNQTINQAWQDSATAPNQNRYPGYGTMLTGNMANATSVGYDAYTPAGPSIKVYNSATNTYAPLANTISTPIANPKGYMVLVRGDRSVITSNAPANATVLRAKGRLYQPTNAPAAVNVTGGKFESIGNPYASAIDFRSLSFTGGVQTDFFYMWDPKLTTTFGNGGSSTYGLGGFQTFSWNGTDFDVTPGGGSYAGNNRFIESGQAFFVAAPFNAGTVSFGENAKVSGSHNVNRVASKPIPQLMTRLHVVSGENTVLVDGVKVQFNAGYSNRVDEKDAVKLINGSENLGLMREGKKLAVESRNPISLNDTVFLNLTQLKIQTYQFEFVPKLLGGQGLTAYLEDRYLRNRTIISLNDTTRFNFSVINNPGSYAADRFIIVFRRADVIIPEVDITLAAQRNLNGIAETRWTVSNEGSIRKYILERSLDGTLFESIVSSEANVRLNGSYQANDLNALPGNCWYRIKSIDADGNVMYSNKVQLDQVPVEPEISVYPNPVKGKRANIECTGMAAGKYNVSLIGVAGVKYNLADIELPSGKSRKIVVLPTGLTPGVYQLQLTYYNGLSIVKTLQVTE